MKQDKLKYIDPGKKEAANAARTAFGADYEAKLRQEAGALPDKLARRKHQISSLFYQAKMKVRRIGTCSCAGPAECWTISAAMKLISKLTRAPREQIAAAKWLCHCSCGCLRSGSQRQNIGRAHCHHPARHQGFYRSRCDNEQE